jgi:hypothetical protein
MCIFYSWILFKAKHIAENNLEKAYANNNITMNYILEKKS